MFKLNTIIFFIVLSVNFSRDGMRYLPGNELSIKTIHYESRDLQWEIQCVLEFIFSGKFEPSFELPFQY